MDVEAKLNETNAAIAELQAAGVSIPDEAIELQEIMRRCVEAERTIAARCARVKMRVVDVNVVRHEDGSLDREQIRAIAIVGHHTEPAGSLDLAIRDPEAMGKLQSGAEFFVELTPANH